MLVDNLMISSNPHFYTEDFFNILEANLEYIRKDDGTKTLPVLPEHVAVYKGDCFSLFNAMHIPTRLHWVCMRLSGMHSPYDFNENITSIVIPNSNMIDQLNQLNQQSPGTVGL